LEVVNTAVRSVQLKSFCSHGPETILLKYWDSIDDDESPYVLVAFMICITLNDVCICSLLLMKKAVSMY
jgi:hypothetical protein